MANPTDLTTYLALARTAISAGDPVTAKTNLLLAQLVLVELPDTTVNGVRITYKGAQELKDLMRTVDTLIGNGGFSTSGCEFG